MRKLAPFVVAAIMYACTTTSTDPKQIVVFGDSITAEVGVDSGCYVNKVKEKFNADTVYQHGYSAHRYSDGCHPNDSNWVTWLGKYVTDVCSHPETDLIIMFGGTNDYGHGMPLGTPADTVQTTSCGGLRYILDYLVAHTTAPIMICTPFPNGACHPLSTTPNSAGLTMAQYVDAYMAVASDECYKGRVYINDTFANCGFDPVNEVDPADRTYTTDGLHLSDLGYERLTDLQIDYYKAEMKK